MVKSQKRVICDFSLILTLCMVYKVEGGATIRVKLVAQKPIEKTVLRNEINPPGPVTFDHEMTQP